MRYNRNWAWECSADVFFTDGSSITVDVQTNNKGRLNWLKIGDEYLEVNEKRLSDLGIASIHFSTPARLEV